MLRDCRKGDMIRSMPHFRCIMPGMAPSVATPQEWLRTFEAAVRARDFAGGRELFATDAMAFGTWARAVAGLDNIVREQWQNVWPRIRGFHFESDTSVRASGD